MQLADMEEGLYGRKCKKRHEYEINCCTRYLPYLRLIFLLEVMLFFGWGCYMLLQTYHPREMKNEARSITPERYPSIMSLSEIQKSRPEMPATFVKPEVIIDKINNFLQNMKFMKDQNLIQNRAIVTNVPSMVQMTLSPRDLMHDKKFTRSPETQGYFSVQYIDKNVNTDENEKHTQFFESTSKIKAINDLEEKFESGNDFTEDINRLTVESQESQALDASNELKNLDSKILTSNLENFVDDTINVDLTNLQNPKLEFFDLIEDAIQNDRNENSFLLDKTDDRVNADLELGLIICPPYESLELFDILINDPGKDSSQPALAQEISKQIGNGSRDDIDERNEDKHDINDSNTATSASTSGNVQDHFDVSVHDVEGQYSSESIAKIKEDEKYESTESIKNSWVLQPTEKGSIESSARNADEFQWFNAPPFFVDLGLGDVPKSSETRSSLLWDTYEDMYIDDVIPGNQCKITIKMGILKVICPAVKFDEEWDFTSSKTPLTTVPKVPNFGEIFDVYLHTVCDENANKKLEVENNFNENSHEEVITSPDSIPKVNSMELQESTTSATNVALLNPSDGASIDPFNSEEFNEDYYTSYDSSLYDYPAFHDYPIYSFPDSNLEDEVKRVTVSTPISEFGSNIINLNRGQNPFLDTSVTQEQEQEQLKISKEQDHSVTETFLKDFEYFYALDKKLTTLFKNEMSNIMTRYLPKSSYGNYQDICSILRYMRSISQHPWREQYAALSKLLEHIRNPETPYPHSTDDSYYRRKRMTDDLTWQQGMSVIYI